MQSLKLNWEVAFLLYGRHLENRNDVITPPPISHEDEIWQADAKSHADDYT